MPVAIKIFQLRLERNYGEAIRFLRARLAQFHFDSEYQTRPLIRCGSLLCSALLAMRLRQKVTAEQARNIFEHLYRDQPDNAFLAAHLSRVDALMGERDSALKVSGTCNLASAPC